MFRLLLPSMPTAAKRPDVPLIAPAEPPQTMRPQPVDLWTWLRAPRRLVRSLAGPSAGPGRRARGVATGTLESADFSGRVLICTIARDLSLLVTSYDRAPATAVEATGDGLLLLQLRLEGDAIFGRDEHAHGCRAALTYFSPGATLTWTLPHGGPWRTLALAGTPEAIESRWGLGRAALKATGWRSHQRSAGDGACHRPWTVTRESLEILRSILDCRLEGNLFHAYCAARSQQLLCEFLAAGPLQPREPPRRQRIEDRVRRARETLLADPGQPHTLQSLAREHGLNRRLLAEGFRVQFDETMFECLQRERLRRAWSLLEHSGEKVATIATRVGYRDAASFARAFKAHFGMTPRQVLSGSTALPGARPAGSPPGAAADDSRSTRSR